jgi:quercetin dioxygenase-like cupin family protein
MNITQMERAPENSTTSLYEMASRRRHLAVMGATIDIHATLEDTNSTFSQIELRVPPRFSGAPPHLHEQMTESFYMIEGSIELLVNETWVTLMPGDSSVVPPRTVHAYRNMTEEYARFLVTAPGHDRFFVELVEWMHREPVWPPADRDALVAFGLRHDTIYV